MATTKRGPSSSLNTPARTAPSKADSRQPAGTKPTSASRSVASKPVSSGTFRADVKAYQASRPKTGPRGPLGPKGEVRAPVGRNAPIGRRGPTGSRGEQKLVSVSGEVGAGKKYGPVSRDVQDVRRLQGPPNLSFADRRALVEERLGAEVERAKQNMFSDFAGDVARTGAQYGPLRNQYAKEINESLGRTARNEALKNLNMDRSMSPAAETSAIRRSASSMIPAARLPSRGAAFSASPPNRMLGNQAFQKRMDIAKDFARTNVRPSGPRTRGEEGPMFKHGGVVKRGKKKTGKK